MQRTKVLILLAILITAIILVSICSYEKKENEIVVQQRLSEVSKYLSDKYGNGVKFNMLNYSTLEEFRAVYCLEDNSNIQFGVDYWVNKQQYSDDYLQHVLANELETIIKDKFAEVDLVDIKITVGSMLGPPFDLTNRLYERYKELGRNPQIQDIKGVEKFSFVTICFNDKKSLDYYKEEINNLLSDLPIERIDCKIQGN